MNRKEQIVQLINGMNSDSKYESYEAEKKLCKILTEVVNKKDAFEDSCGAYIDNYPERIYSIDEETYCRNVNELPKYIYIVMMGFYFRNSLVRHRL